eukprot:gnl/TRDRNA2_/TRDRNA2_165777_c0_seq1.p2 gnl/TRDRNA2_/TRDRNA2_165777_c0~~gnl/TRDRNA2_/TRDRNA2_165777_c0_seq1.p2  ORF type:complete len:169 (-),score=30.84 gnl/TRDRNA2_/TRDRNA2_165777_c0_seq1:238-744(-)
MLSPRSIGITTALWTLLVAAVDDKCSPMTPFESTKAACAACHTCREENKCPCSSFSEGDKHFFCYDPNAPDLLTGHDLHNHEMHCDALTKSTVQVCADNAVDDMSSEDTRLYSVQSSVVDHGGYKVPFLAPVSLAVLFVAGLGMIAARFVGSRTVVEQGEELEAAVLE